MVAQDQDAVRLDRGGKMAVADVPGEFGKVDGVAGADVVELLLGRHDLDRASVVEHQPVAVRQRDRLGQIDQELVAARERSTRRRRCRSSCGSTAESKAGTVDSPARRDSASARQLGEVGVEGEFHFRSVANDVP